MLNELTKQFATQIESFFYLLMIINGVLHLIFASAVAKDAGKLTGLGQRPVLVSGATWAFATLIGGVLIASIYWILHYSTLTRPALREFK
ncbi:MAG: hypothetical protein CK426_02610 [Legionella sp.]|nr:MAG: hypothetical protein CK423_03410 [Legionella sp.]PJD99688.1 MAG: hypothetical protein CK426_02610 [Legionella sp.]